MANEQEDASQAIGASLEAWVNSLPSDDGESVGILGDWVAVVCMVDVTPEGVPVANYYIALKDGQMLPHVAHGLLVRGADELDGLEEGGN